MGYHLKVLSWTTYYLFVMLICDGVFQEFSPGSNGRMTTMGVYIRDLLLGQVCYL